MAAAARSVSLDLDRGRMQEWEHKYQDLLSENSNPGSPSNSTIIGGILARLTTVEKRVAKSEENMWMEQLKARSEALSKESSKQKSELAKVINRLTQLDTYVKEIRKSIKHLAKNVGSGETFVKEMSSSAKHQEQYQDPQQDTSGPVPAFPTFGQEQLAQKLSYPTFGAEQLAEKLESANKPRSTEQLAEKLESPKLQSTEQLGENADKVTSMIDCILNDLTSLKQKFEIRQDSARQSLAADKRSTDIGRSNGAQADDSVFLEEMLKLQKTMDSVRLQQSLLQLNPKLPAAQEIGNITQIPQDISQDLTGIFSALRTVMDLAVGGSKTATNAETRDRSPDGFNWMSMNKQSTGRANIGRSTSPISRSRIKSATSRDTSPAPEVLEENAPIKQKLTARMVPPPISIGSPPNQRQTLPSYLSYGQVAPQLSNSFALPKRNEAPFGRRSIGSPTQNMRSNSPTLGLPAQSQNLEEYSPTRISAQFKTLVL